MSHRSHFVSFFIAFSVIFIAVCICFLLLTGSVGKTVGDTSLAASGFPTVIIDAGHGGEDGGAVGIDGSYEKDLNLDIAKKLFDELTSSGIECVMTRSEDTLLYDRNQDYRGRKKELDMKARLDITQRYDDAVFISIHQNAFTVEKYSGFQVYFSPNNESSYALAKILEDQVKMELQPENRRVAKPSDGKIYLLDKLSCPAVLVECGFISNAEECARLNTEEYRARLAATLSDSIVAFLNKRDQ